jgi:hypothetical protein
MHDYLLEANRVAAALGIDFSKERFTAADLARGISVEYEHGRELSAAQCGHPDTNVTNDDLIATAKIALAHLYERREYPDRTGGRCGDQDTRYDYYDGLNLVETAPVGYWRGTENYWLHKSIGRLVVAVIIILLVAIAADHFGAIQLGPRVRGLSILISIVGAIYISRTWK